MAFSIACITKPLGWFPVIIINAIGVWSYFAYVIILCFDHVKNPVERGLYLAFYHPIFVMFMATYWKAITSTPGYAPSQFHLSNDDFVKYDSSDNPQEVLKELVRELPVLTKSVNNGVRFCELCCLVKPDRSHHCSMCRRCVLKMDHHCPWINNCVGWANYKYFILFLGYSIIYTMFVALTSLKYFINFWSAHNMKANSGLHILFLFFVAAMFSISLWSLFGFHVFLCMKNRTTLESFRAPIFQHGPDKNGFNLGSWNNFYQVFGNKKWKWFLPTFTSLGNGYIYSTTKTVNPEYAGLLVSCEDDDMTHHVESDLMNYEEPRSINTNTAYLHRNGFLDTSIIDDDEEDITFDRTQSHKNGHIVLDVNSMEGIG